MKTLSEQFDRYQHDRYHEGAMGTLVRSCHSRYLEAARLIEVCTPLSKNIRDRWDHRTTQESYYLIAERYLNCLGLEQPPLEFDGSEQIFKEICASWEVFWKNICNVLIQDNNFVLDICYATAFENTETGYAAEERLHERLRDWYLYHEDAWPKLFEARLGKG